MGNVTYRSTPPLWAVSECEDRYENMAAMGWLLKKRGVFLDKYRRCQPQQLRYRLEISGSTFWKGTQPLPEEQLQLYEDCGWTLALRSGDIYIFCAPKDNVVPEIYNNGTQQAAMLAGLNKRYRRDVLGAVFWLCWLFVLAAIRKVDLLSWKTLAEADLLFTGLLLFWLLMLWKAGYGMVRMRLLINRLKGGAVMAHGPSRQRNHPVSRVITGVLSALLLICFVGVGAERLLDNTVPLPETAAGLPYLLGTEVFDARRAGPDEVSSYRKKINVVQTSPTLFAPVQYHTNEDFVLSGGASGTLYQHIYEVRTLELAQKLAWSLAEDSVFSPLDGYIRVNIAGLDLAMRSNGGMEVIAAKGNTAVYAILIGPDGPEGQMRLLEAYGQKLQLESQGD